VMEPPALLRRTCDARLTPAPTVGVVERAWRSWPDALALGRFVSALDFPLRLPEGRREKISPRKKALGV
jgi:hypothetical protein